MVAWLLIIGYRLPIVRARARGRRSSVQGWSIRSLLMTAVQRSGLKGMQAWARMAPFSMRVNSGAKVIPRWA